MLVYISQWRGLNQASQILVQALAAVRICGAPAVARHEDVPKPSNVLSIDRAALDPVWHEISC